MSEKAEGEFVVEADLGMHARPAARFVMLANELGCAIGVGKDDEWVNGCSRLSILSLAASTGTVFRVRATGVGADRAGA